MPLQNVIQETIQYTHQRKIFNQPVLHNQTVHFRLAELETEVELLRSLLYRAVAHYVKGNDVTKLASMAKLKAGRLAREVCDSCLQFWGGMGFTNEVLVSRLYSKREDSFVFNSGIGPGLKTESAFSSQSLVNQLCIQLLICRQLQVVSTVD
nr:PREDICTED: probable acyl-CoA dehydrogenase 6 isoform X1 [Latimeria chalumnae]|eukprot:XP_014350711.1 PREDICTED: probable acyl-CoA dehydrogenase 6 isoform X1 [Latimeria chalumnae]